MNIPNIIMLLSVVILFSCNHSTKHATKKNSNAFTNRSTTDTSNSQMYDFLKMVFSQELLDTSYGFISEPIKYLDSVIPDSIFLKQLLIDDPKKKIKKKSSNEVTITASEFEKCLTMEDIDFMLNQKAKYLGFKWDGLRLNLTPTTKFGFYGKEYAFSIPLFSKDGRKVLISYDSYANGGCILLLKKKNGDWITQRGSQWIH